MARKNIHQSKRLKSHKPPVAVQAKTAPVSTPQPIPVATAVKTAPVKAGAGQQSAAVRFAELPYELRRIALFSAFVVGLLIVLWFFLK
jgi:hypothetical protein